MITPGAVIALVRPQQICCALRRAAVMSHPAAASSGVCQQRQLMTSVRPPAARPATAASQKWPPRSSSLGTRQSGWDPLTTPAACTQRRAAGAASAEGMPGGKGQGLEEMTGQVLFARALFGTPEFLFVMPPFQRPYSWGEYEAATMLEDLLTYAPHSAEQIPEKPMYMLGPINLAKGPPVSPLSNDMVKKFVVDGQQRIVTMCLLFAAARERFLTDDQYTEIADELKGYLQQVKVKSNQIEEQPRVVMARREDTDFLSKLLLSGPSSEDEAGGERLSGESQPKLWSNMQLYRQMLSGVDLPRLEALIQYTLNRVTLTVTTCSSITTSLKYFAVSSQRGMQLQPIDVLKAYVFDPSNMPEDKQVTYGRLWGDLEGRSGVGRAILNRVCRHLTVIHLRQQPGSSNEFEDFPQLLAELTTGSAAADAGVAGAAFFDEVLSPYTELYLDMLRNKCVIRDASKEDQARASYLLTCLHRLHPPPKKDAESSKKDADWEPVVMAALMQHMLGHLSTDALLVLLSDVERVCWLWTLPTPRRTPKARAQRMKQALQGLGLGGGSSGNVDTGEGFSASSGNSQQGRQLIPAVTSERSPTLALTDEEKVVTLSVLEGPVYKTLSRRACAYVLVRLNEQEYITTNAMYMHPYNMDDKNLTLEHVFPQNPAQGSGWDAFFSEEEADRWVHRLGNLVLLHKSSNSSAKNKSFQKKKEAYKQYAQHFPRTQDVAQQACWDSDSVEAQQDRLLTDARKCWQL